MEDRVKILTFICVIMFIFCVIIIFMKTLEKKENYNQYQNDLNKPYITLSRLQAQAIVNGTATLNKNVRGEIIFIWTKDLLPD